MKERLAVLEEWRKKTDKLINSCTELYGSCIHKTKFYSYKKYATSTDEGEQTPERSVVSRINSPYPVLESPVNFTCYECTSPGTYVSSNI